MKISSGSQIIDTLLEGGFEPEVINTIYGGAGSGKTNIVMITALTAAKHGKVIFIDSEGGFSIDRAKQIFASDYKERLNNLILSKPTTFQNQKELFDELAEKANKEQVKLIVVDSISMLYRLELGSSEAHDANKEMARQMGILRKLSHDLKIPIILTNQVYADFENPGDVRMVGGDLMKYFSKCIIKLESVDSQISKAEVIKHRSLPNKAVFFEIKSKGLFEAEEPKKKFSLF